MHSKSQGKENKKGKERENEKGNIRKGKKTKKERGEFFWRFDFFYCRKKKGPVRVLSHKPKRQKLLGEKTKIPLGHPTSMWKRKLRQKMSLLLRKHIGLNWIDSNRQIEGFFLPFVITS